MTTRIIFNGQAYDNAEAMPPEVRQAYDQVLAKLADANKNGIPDILERGAAGNVFGIQHSSITVNGQTYGGASEMPEPMRRLYEQAMSQVDRQNPRAADVTEVVMTGSGANKFLPSPGKSTPADPWLIKSREADGHPLSKVVIFIALAILAGAVFLLFRR